MKPSNLTKVYKAVTLFFVLLFHSVLMAQSISVPVDHNRPKGEHFELSYEFGSTYNPQLPTIIVIADPQQFYVQKGRIAKIQAELFGENFNVLGIIPRSNNTALRKRTLSPDGPTDWLKAYTLFNADQLVRDIELVRQKLFADTDSIFLYGQSGGAYLITQYLSAFPQSPIQKVFIGAAVSPAIEAQLGVLHDNFSREFLNKHPAVAQQLHQILDEEFFKRELVAQLFQRQNFFVPLDSLEAHRIELMAQLHAKDTAYISALRKSYQIDVLAAFFETDYGIPIRIRLYEFIFPLIDRLKKNNLSIFYPNLEHSYNVASPLLDLQQAGQLPSPPSLKPQKLRNFHGEVLVLAGRYDHVVDYRTSIYLSALFKNGRLLILDDDHTFKSLKAVNQYAGLIQDFFKKKTVNQWIEAYSPYLWQEN